MLTDPIADMLSRIRNAHMALHKEVRIPSSRVKSSIARILEDEGYVESVKVEGREIFIRLKYVSGKPAIEGLQRISTPGRRCYVGFKKIVDVQNGLGISILSTSQGIIEGSIARNKKIGGELLCKIW